jgi:D-glycero-D-manno-heptose 1,7-bisphosphate phosphatase
MLRVFDKDGTLVETKSGETFPKLGDQRLIPGVKERIAAYKEAGDIIVVASNQGGIPQHKSLEDAIAEFQEVMELLPEISVCFFCPDFEGKDCWMVPNSSLKIEGFQFPVEPIYYPRSSDLVGSFRKPNPGMLKAAMLWASVDSCTYVGDRPEDESAAIAAGVPYQHVSHWLAD